MDWIELLVMEISSEMLEMEIGLPVDSALVAPSCPEQDLVALLIFHVCGE